MPEFCDLLKVLDVKCKPCYDNKVSTCDIKLGEQEYYKGFAMYDTITIERWGTSLQVQSDIEVTYQTRFPYGPNSEKREVRDGWEKELNEKEAAIQKYVYGKMHFGVLLLPPHLHYNPNKHDPKRVAIHIHAFKRVESIEDAKKVSEDFAKYINPKLIGEAIK